MGIYTKFDVGDEVYHLQNGGIYKFKVDSIEISVHSNEDVYVDCRVEIEKGQYVRISEEELYESKEEIIAKLLSECKERGI